MTASGICMLVHADYPADPRVRRAAHAARDAGCCVDVVCLAEPGRPRRETIEGIGVHRLPVGKERAGVLHMLGAYVRFTLLATWFLARSLVTGPRYDVVHVNNPPDFLIVAGVLPKLFGCRLILDIHDITPLMFSARFGGRRGERAIVAALTGVERAAAAIADEVVTVHQPYRDELAGHGVDPERVTIVMNPPDDRLLDRVRAKANGDGNGRDREFLVAYHGTITPWYGLPLMVRALADAAPALGDWRCVIVGDGDDVAATRRVAGELGVAERIDFLGRRPLEETLEIVMHADCGVIPNLPCELNRLTLSTKLLEYASLGVPAVAARLDTLAWHFGPDEVEFFDPGDRASLAAAIAAVARDPDRAAARAERARRKAERYAWPANRERYQRLLGADRSGDVQSSHSRLPTAEARR